MTVNVYEKLGNKISEEVQLRAEEKWILEALEKIKDERNRLKIEALHLESLKAKYNYKKKESTITKDSQPIALPQTNHHIEIDNEEELCNNEELNLMVSDRPTLVKRIVEDNSEEEEEEEEEDEDEEEEDDEDADDVDVDDIILDINMLMFGNKMD